MAIGFETDEFIREKTKKEKLIAKKKVEATRSFNASRLVHFYNETSANERKLFILAKNLLEELQEKNGNEPSQGILERLELFSPTDGISEETETLWQTFKLRKN